MMRNRAISLQSLVNPSVLVLIKLNEPGMKDERTTVRNPDLGLIIREETTVRNPMGKTQPTLGWMKSTETYKFPVSAAKVGMGVAELLVNPVSQGWRTKPNQKEFLKKIGEVENFKKNDDGKRNEDFRNDEGFDKADVLRRLMILSLINLRTRKSF